MYIIPRQTCKSMEHVYNSLIYYWIKSHNSGTKKVKIIKWHSNPQITIVYVVILQASDGECSVHFIQNLPFIHYFWLLAVPYFSERKISNIVIIHVLHSCVSLFFLQIMWQFINYWSQQMNHSDLEELSFSPYTQNYHCVQLYLL